MRIYCRLSLKARILIKLGYIVGFWFEMAISTIPKPTIYRNLYENTGPGTDLDLEHLVGGNLDLLADSLTPPPSSHFLE